jgi:hypothetical protein
MKTMSDPDVLADAMCYAIERATKPLMERIDSLERRCVSLETATTSKGVRWHGTHAAARAYPEGALVTRAGSLWLATRDTALTPGAGESGWTLVVKAGDYSKEKR